MHWFHFDDRTEDSILWIFLFWRRSDVVLKYKQVFSELRKTDEPVRYYAEYLASKHALNLFIAVSIHQWIRNKFKVERNRRWSVSSGRRLRSTKEQTVYILLIISKFCYPTMLGSFINAAILHRELSDLVWKFDQVLTNIWQAYYFEIKSP